MLKVTFLKEIDNAHAKRQSKYGVAEKGQGHVQRQPKSLQSRRNLAGAPAYREGGERHQKRQRRDDAAQHRERILELDQQINAHQQPAIEQQGVAHDSDGGKAFAKK